MRKDDSPSGPGHGGTSGPRDPAPVVERDERDRRALAARISDNAGPPSVPVVPAATNGQTGTPAAAPAEVAAQPRRGRSSRSRATAPALIGPATAEEVNHRIREVLATFVDTPADAVSDADEVLAQLVKALTEALTTRQRELRGRRTAAGTDTEQLRQSLLAYRATVQALLKA